MSGFAKKTGTEPAGPALDCSSYVAIVLDITGELVISPHAAWFMPMLHFSGSPSSVVPGVYGRCFSKIKRVLTAARPCAQVLWVLRSKA